MPQHFYIYRDPEDLIWSWQLIDDTGEVLAESPSQGYTSCELAEVACDTLFDAAAAAILVFDPKSCNGD